MQEAKGSTSSVNESACSRLGSLPPDSRLPINRLERIFSSTTASYKYYWFLGFLDKVVNKGSTFIESSELADFMVASAWFPTSIFHVRFGKLDRLSDIVEKLFVKLETSPDELKSRFRNIEEVTSFVVEQKNQDDAINNLIQGLLRYVPYKFLSPWNEEFYRKDKTEKGQRLIAHQIHNDGLYRLVVKNGKEYLAVNNKWIPYLKENYLILQEFAKWNLAQYFQAKNAGFPGIIDKLDPPPAVRDPLTKQHKFWDELIKQGLRIDCIYTHTPIVAGEYDLDHFLPWSFLVNNYIWNLVPANPSINSSKGNRLPDLDIYLKKFAITQQEALKVCFADGLSQSELLDDYATMPYMKEAYDISQLDKDSLFKFYEENFKPLHSLATSHGFAPWD